MGYQYFDNQYDEFLAHYQIPGAKHGVRRFQNLDGSWTPAGRERYGKGGKPRGDYKDEGKTAAKNLMKTSSVGKASHLSGADFDSNTKFIVSKEDVYSDFKQAVKDARHSNHETVKYLSDKDSIKKLAEGTQASYEKYQTAAKIYQQLNSSEKASQLDLDAFRSAKTKYKEELKEVADKLLGRLKDNQVTTIGEYDGKPVPVSTTYSKLIADALWEANVERNKNIKRLSGADFDGDDVKKVIRLNKDNEDNNKAVPEPSRAEKKLADTKQKLADIAEEKRSPQYLKNLDKKRDLESRLERLHDKTQRIRDNKIFKDKQPGFFDNLKLNKERRLEKKLSKVNKQLGKVDKAESKLTKKEAKYERKVDRQYKYDEKTREAMREAREDGYDSLTPSQKKLLREVAYDMMDEI